MVGAGVRSRVAYFFDDDTGAFAYTLQHPMKPHRIKMAHNLVTNYGLDQHMEILRPSRATAHEMTAFHTDEYIDFVKSVTPETVDELTGNGTRFLIGEDCPAFDGLWDFCGISAGGSISSARRLNSGEADIAINWAGGLHHAKKREASGFCYINDIVLAILELLRYHARVLYIDIDVHHGDGVEEAFYSTDRVMTCSLHKFGDFFPGTGDLKDKGIGKGKGYSVNVPLQDGVDDETYKSLFEPIIQHIIDWYRPGAIVLQCGADSLAEDKLGCFNLSMQGHANCVRFVKSFNLPMIILGGGGYTIRNVSRTWAYETGIAVGQELDKELPFNEYIEHFGPEFKMEVPPNNMTNLNTREICDHIRSEILEGLRSMPFAPGAAMRAVPTDPDADLLEDDGDPDIRITQRQRDAHVSRYGDVLSDSEEDDGGYSSLYRRPGNGFSASPEEQLTRGSRRRKARRHYDDSEAEVTPGYGAVQPNGEEVAPPKKRTFFRSYVPQVQAISVPQFFVRGHISEDPTRATHAMGGGILATLGGRSDSPGLGL